MADTPFHAAVAAQNEQFMQAANAGDARALAALYTDDATLLPPDAPMAQGRSNVEAFWSAALQQIESVKLTSVDVSEFGEGAVREIGRAHLTLKGRTEPVSGKYVVIWKRVGSQWQLDTDIWNRDG